MPDSIDKLLSMAQRHCGENIPRDRSIPVARGASGRTIVRIALPGGGNMIGVHWTKDRDDNDSFVPVARLLDSAGVRVPRILDDEREAPGAGLALVSDLGDRDLLSCSGMEWDMLKGLYVSAMTELNKLHRVSIPSGFHLQAPFDLSLYRWEQEYFAEHFIQNRQGMSPQPFLNSAEMNNLAQRLSILPRMPLHRDFQSQNIHIVDGEAWLIDFQGMRMGLPEYDLASLLYDPYARLSASQREELAASWEKITGKTLNPALFRDCAIQRIMQATGAFAKLSLMGNSWYEGHLPVALTTLRELTASTPYEEVFAAVLTIDSSAS